MATNMSPQFEEKRFALRMALRLPIVVSGRADDGAAWSEPTENLYLRSHRPDGVPVEVKARVVRVAPAVHGTSRVGVEIVESKENWLRLFVAWVADDQSEEES